MSIYKESETIVGNGVALNTSATALTSTTSQIAVIGTNGSTITSSSSIGAVPAISITNLNADGSYKISNVLKGTSITGWKGSKYAPTQRSVSAIGYDRQAAAGSIEVNNSTEYAFRILFTNDKSFYSERPEAGSFTFTSAAAATQLTVAVQVAAAINASGFGSSIPGVKTVSAIIVGDGTGVVAASGSTPAIYGGTGATNYGVEIMGEVINQFQNTQYAEEIVRFDTYVDSTSGFGATTNTTIQLGSKGIGTYNQVYNSENFDYKLLNRTAWPVPTQAFLASSTGALSASVAAATTDPTGNAATTSTADTLTVTDTTGLRSGEVIDVNGVAYEIKYIASATVAILTAPASASYSGANLFVRYFYNELSITATDVTVQDGAGAGQFSKKIVKIFPTAIDAADTDPFLHGLTAAGASAETATLVPHLNTWMATTPLAPTAVTLA